MLVFDVREPLDVTPEVAWKHLLDWDSAARWMPGVEALRAEGETAVGTRLVFVARGRERTSTVTAFDPGRAVTLESVQGGVIARYHYAVEPSNSGGAALRLRVECDVRGPLRLIAPMITAAIRRSDGVQPARFRAWVERR